MNNIITRQLFFVVFLYTLPVISSIFWHVNGNLNPEPKVSFGYVVAAEQTKSVKVPAIRNRVYGQLARAQKLSEEGDVAKSIEVLDAVKERLDSLNSYEIAMLWNFYGFIYYGNDDIALATQSFEKVVEQQAIPNSLRLSTLYSLAQLSMQQKEYDKAIDHLTTWKGLLDKPITPTQSVLFAQIYYQNKDYKKASYAINEAVGRVEAEGKVAKENWYILQRAAFYELKMPKEVTLVMEKLVKHFDNPAYWLQLAGMYAEIGEEKKQLAVMEAAWQAGYIEDKSQILSLAQLYRYHEAPYKAAKLLEASIENGAVTAEVKHLDMLAQAYIAAKEPQKAIPVFKQASQIVENGEYDAQIAQTYLNSEKWEQAAGYAERAIERGGLEMEGTAYLVLGMAKFNLKEFESSLQALNKATTFAKSKKTAQQWVKYVEREHAHQLRLAMVR